MVSGFQRDEKMISNINNSLSFKKKTVRIDWRKIASVDLDRIARELDVYTLQENLDHLTFCNIDAEIDTRMIDPNYIKLFKMSQFTIEYLVHSQTYLTDVIATVESQLNTMSAESEELKKLNEKLQKELLEVKKENKKRKKMIETQQTLMNATSSNYHQCAFCSKVFLNISYLQAHMARRHSDISQPLKATTEIEKELERIKERLRLTENDLMMERNSRLNLTNVHLQNPDSSALIKQMEEFKNSEIKRQKEELKKTKEGFRKEIQELNQKNLSFEQTIKELKEKLAQKSNVGWIKDDIDLEKDTAIKLKQDIEKLNENIKIYKKQIEEYEELKTKWKAKENSMKKQHFKEIQEKDSEIVNLKARLVEMQNSLGKSDKELANRIEELQTLLQQEQKLRYEYEIELSELRNRPPPVTPRQQNPPITRSPSPPKQTAILNKSAPHPSLNDIYLVEYCPLTFKAVQSNKNHLDKYREYAIQLFEKELDEMGIDSNDKGLSSNDFKLKMNMVKQNRSSRTDDMPVFNELRHVFQELSEKFSNQKLNSSLRSSIGNRVTFKKDIEAINEYDKGLNHINNKKKQYEENANTRIHQGHLEEQSEETDDDVSLSNALESDEDDTEPTKSAINDNSHLKISNDFSENRNNRLSPNKNFKNSGNINPDEISDLESISQLLSDRSLGRKNNTYNKNINNSKNLSVNDAKKKLEKKLDSSKRATKPTPNAVPVGFQASVSRSKNQKIKDDDSFSSVSDIELENGPKQTRPKSGVRSSLQDSNSSSIWISESHSNDINLNNQPNERPATANSLKTSNFDSDEIDNGI